MAAGSPADSHIKCKNLILYFPIDFLLAALYFKNLGMIIEAFYVFIITVRERAVTIRKDRPGLFKPGHLYFRERIADERPPPDQTD